MIDGVEFSDRGERPTEFETQLLLSQDDCSSAWVALAQRLITDIGVDAGMAALAAVLDEVGGEKIHVPTRRGLFGRLWGARRTAMILELAAERRYTNTEIADRCGVSLAYVGQLLAAKGGGPTARSGRGTGRRHD